jgi:hypothetical protein
VLGAGFGFVHEDVSKMFRDRRLLDIEQGSHLLLRKPNRLALKPDFDAAAVRFVDANLAHEGALVIAVR